MTAVVERIRAVEHDLLVARLSLLLLVVNVNETPVLLVGTAAATLFLFLRPHLLRSPWPWFAFTAVIGLDQALEWWIVDDHVVVTAYWIFAIGLSRVADDPRSFLAVNARLLIGLVFAFAFGWKLLSSQYMSTDFFRYELLLDSRFDLVAEHVGRTSPSTISSNVDVVNDLYNEGAPGASVVLDEGANNAAVATVFTYWGLLIEGATAAAFLLPLRGRARWLRPITLFAFAYTTYLVVPIAGFGALLMVLGLAMTHDARMRAVYVSSFGALLVWGAIFPQLL